MSSHSPTMIVVSLLGSYGLVPGSDCHVDLDLIGFVSTRKYYCCCMQGAPCGCNCSNLPFFSK
eukprot:3843638-Amphidinium_carterae.1